ncbi:IclR family transcriptional regulator [Microbacterium sp. 179-I 3D3 NHS]|uniref:IclR family transcriptional regulator n=1 Tax=Microbacterium sp. 179-I 3D3 NHS TaxID=3142382 RepID=UPI00399EE9D9
MPKEANGVETVSTGVDRALQIISTMASHGEPDMGISQLARETGMSKAVVHRIVRTLVARDFFSYDDGSQRYGLGSGALVVGLAALERMNVPEIAASYLQRVVEETHETATLSARIGHHRTYVRQQLSPREIHMSIRIGSQFPLYRGASSLAILGALDDDEVHSILDEGTAAEPAIDTARVLDQVAEVRERGYAYSRGERQLGAASVACAIRLADGSVWGSASVCGPADRFTPEAVADYSGRIHSAAASISQDIGFRGDIY